MCLVWITRDMRRLIQVTCGVEIFTRPARNINQCMSSPLNLETIASDSNSKSSLFQFWYSLVTRKMSQKSTERRRKHYKTETLQQTWSPTAHHSGITTYIQINYHTWSTAGIHFTRRQVSWLAFLMEHAQLENVVMFLAESGDILVVISAVHVVIMAKSRRMRLCTRSTDCHRLGDCWRIHCLFGDCGTIWQRSSATKAEHTIRRTDNKAHLLL